MDTIPAAHRSVEMNMTHGRWLQTMGLDRTALQAYRNVLSVAPHALEAVFALVQVRRIQWWKVKGRQLERSTNQGKKGTDKES